MYVRVRIYVYVCVQGPKDRETLDNYNKQPFIR